MQLFRSAVPALLCLPFLGFGCAASARKAESPSTPLVVGPVPAAGALPPGPPPAALHVRTCRIETSSHGTLTTNIADLTFGADAAGDVVDVHVVAGDTTVAMNRSYDAARRFMSERRRVTSPTGEIRTTFTWRRDPAGHVTYAERAEETRGGPSAPLGRLIVATVTERHPSGRWLRRETRDPEASFRTETRTFDLDGRVTTMREEVTARASQPAATTVTRFTYTGRSERPHLEKIELLAPGESPRTKREIEYDEKGRPAVDHIWVSDGGDPREEGAWTLTYDAAGRLASRVRGDGLGASYAYVGDCPTNVEELVSEPKSAKD